MAWNGSARYEMAGVACVAWSFSKMENHSSASALALLGCLESWNVGMLECWNAVKVLWRVANSCTMQCQLDAKTRSSFRRCDGWAMSQ